MAESWGKRKVSADYAIISELGGWVILPFLAEVNSRT